MSRQQHQQHSQYQQVPSSTFSTSSTPSSSPALTRTTLVASLVAAAFLAACGGGGGDAPPAPPLPGGSGASTGYQVSGTVKISENTQVDSDVNDPNAAYAANDTPGTAQALPNPFNLGGYVNVAGQGPSGRSRAAGDRSDFFRVDAVQGQAVTLTIGSPGQGDLDLYLYDVNGTEVARSIGTGKLESITIPASAPYYIRVYAATGASAYVLTLGQSATAAQDPAMLQSEAEFVPGDVIVHWNTPAQAMAKMQAQGQVGATTPQPGTTNLQSSEVTLSKLGLSQVAEPPVGPALLKLNNPGRTLLQATQARGLASTAQAQAGSTPTTADAKAATLEAIKQLRADPNVAYAEPNYILRADAVPNDPYYRLQWHYPLINLPTAWDTTRGANTVTVAVVDTGVLLGHPDLQGQLVPGYDFVSDPVSAGDNDGIDNNPDDPGDQSGVNGTSSFHGTHVAGTIAALSNNGTGVAGIAPLARIMPVRVLGRRGGATFDVLQGVLYAAGLPNASNTLPARRADIINLSLGGAQFSQAAQDVYAQVRAQGVIVVAAAGNAHSTANTYPASYPGVLSVSATTINRTLASYSNSGPRISLAAPGGDNGDANGDGSVDKIYSTCGDDSSGRILYTYCLMAGTSMATPHVAGVLALMKAVRPSLTPAEVDTLLAAGRLTIDIGAPGRDDSFGYGLIDAVKAVQAAQGGTGSAPGLLVANPSAINLPPSASTVRIVVGNGGDQPLAAPTVEVSPANSWLSVSPPTGSANGLGDYTLTVNRGTLAPGAYKGSVRFVSGSTSATVSVVMQVTAGGASARADLGQHYVLLINPDTMRAAHQVMVRATNGAYPFQFTNVPAGKYLLAAGSDADNDGSICGLGEACGMYLDLNNPSPINVTGNLSGQDFFSSFVSTIGASSNDGSASTVRQIKRMD